jgi:hypothetical protein
MRPVQPFPKSKIVPNAANNHVSSEYINPIHERDVSEGERRQKIDIYYNFAGNLDDGEHTLGDRRWKDYRSEKYPVVYDRPTTYKKSLPARLF